MLFRHMTKTLFYIIIISQIWLSIGSSFVHLISQECDLIELIGEEEKEKEKEIEKELEKIHDKSQYIVETFKEVVQASIHNNSIDFLGSTHLEINTPPPERSSFLS